MKDIAQIMRDGTAIDAAFKRAVRAAILEHKRAGRSIVVWRDDKVVWIPADEIDVDRLPEGDVASGPANK